MNPQHCDAIVIGSGAGGAAAAFSAVPPRSAQLEAKSARFRPRLRFSCIRSLRR